MVVLFVHTEKRPLSLLRYLYKKIVIGNVLLFRLFVMLLPFDFSKSKSPFFHEIWHRCSIYVSYVTVIWKVKVKVQGQNCCIENLQIL